MSAKNTSKVIKAIEDSLAGMERSDQEHVYKFLRKLLGYDDPDMARVSSPARKFDSDPFGSGADEIPVKPDPDDYHRPATRHSISAPGSRMVDDEDEYEEEEDDEETEEEQDEEEEDEEDDSCTWPTPKPKPKKKEVTKGVSVLDREWNESMTDFNPDTAKNVLQQYYQTFIHPSMTPTYIREYGYSIVRFQIERGGESIEIKGYGKRAVEEEKNAALRAIVFLEKNNPKFRTLRLPANARLQRETREAGGRSSSSNAYGLSELNAACFLMYCRDTGVIQGVNRSPKDAPGGGFMGCTRLVCERISPPEFKTPMYGKKKDAQNAADLLAAQWVVENLHVRVPAGMAMK